MLSRESGLKMTRYFLEFLNFDVDQSFSLMLNYFEQVYGHINDDAHVRLLRDNSDDIEINCGATGPPSFVGQSEALQYQLGRAENKIEILNKIYSQHLARPTLDDFSQEETEIKALSTEITQVCKLYRYL